MNRLLNADDTYSRSNGRQYRERESDSESAPEKRLTVIAEFLQRLRRVSSVVGRHPGKGLAEKNPFGRPAFEIA